MTAIVSDRRLATKWVMRREATDAARRYREEFPGEDATPVVREHGSRFYVVVIGDRFAGWLQSMPKGPV